jgi:uncharacterized membrane protein YcaP (DUF421 family)
MWHDIFPVGAPVLEKILRPIAIYFFLVALRVNYLVVRFLFRHRRLDQMFEGRPTVLVERGCIVKKALAKELLTRAELLTVLHRQGFDSLDEVEHCVLEPGGTFYIQRRMPPAEEVQHAEVMLRLREIQAKLDRLLGPEARAGSPV